MSFQKIFLTRKVKKTFSGLGLESQISEELTTRKGAFACLSLLLVSTAVAADVRGSSHKCVLHSCSHVTTKNFPKLR